MTNVLFQSNNQRLTGTGHNDLAGIEAYHVKDDGDRICRVAVNGKFTIDITNGYHCRSGGGFQCYANTRNTHLLYVFDFTVNNGLRLGLYGKQAYGKEESQTPNLFDM
ncbi:hypothetical protein SDC9_102629 [bioreactor metagenome]|uniref:Uncharacterized protein n=1 Tax=bioreactor metagenome TaxID=1076179 RepID=A0A645ARD9_9ZZZZ